MAFLCFIIIMEVMPYLFGKVEARHAAEESHEQARRNEGEDALPKQKTYDLLSCSPGSIGADRAACYLPGHVRVWDGLPRRLSGGWHPLSDRERSSFHRTGVPEYSLARTLGRRASSPLRLQACSFAG